MIRERVWGVSETPTNTLQYRFDGREDAPVLILGPSLGTTWHMWDRQVPELTKQWRVFRFDLPGHGGAPAHPAGFVSELTTRLLATLDSLGVQRFGYAGCALGGAMGVELALRHPERLASLVLIAASPRFGTADEFRQRGVIVRTNGLDPIARTSPDRWFTTGFAAAQPAITDWAVQMVRTTDPGCCIAACEALATFDVRPAGPGGRADPGAGGLGGPGHRPRRGPHPGRRDPRRPARGRPGRLPPGAGGAARRGHGPAGDPLLHGLAAARRPGHRPDRHRGDAGQAGPRRRARPRRPRPSPRSPRPPPSRRP
ncbi:Putative aminoacrylate hydrolase RutD [Streptomyces glaucescens]